MRIVVVGGGVAGLCAAWRAKAQGAEVVLLEASSRLGGQILTEHVSDCVLEHGAEGFVAHSTAIHEVCDRLGLATDVISQTVSRALVAEDGVLREVPPGEAGRRLGIQARPADWGQGLQSLRRGMGSLVEAMTAAIGQDRIRLTTPVEAVEPVHGRPSGGWLVHSGTGTSFEADGVIVALPASAAGTVAPGGRSGSGGRAPAARDGLIAVGDACRGQGPRSPPARCHRCGSGGYRGPGRAAGVQLRLVEVRRSGCRQSMRHSGVLSTTGWRVGRPGAVGATDTGLSGADHRP